MNKLRILANVSMLGLTLSTLPAMAKDYLAAAAHPDQVVIIDTEKYAIEKVLHVEKSGPTPIVPAISPDAKYVYVLANGSESIVKIDMATGKNIAHLDMSTYDTQVKAVWGMTLSPDGKTLAVYQNPVKKLLTEFQVQPTQIAYYDAETLKLKFTAPAPRQIVTLTYSTDGTKLYGMGRNFYVFDSKDGKQLDELPMQGWSPETHFPSDVLNVWSQYETSNMIAAPFYTKRKDKAADDPDAFKTGLFTFDLVTGKMAMNEVETTQTLYFSASASPDHKRAYAVYNVLQSFDLENGGKPLKQVPLPHTYYAVIVTPDNKTVWVGGGGGDFIAFDAETLEKKGEVKLPGNGSMSNNSVRLFSTR